MNKIQIQTSAKSKATAAREWEKEYERMSQWTQCDLLRIVSDRLCIFFIYKHMAEVYGLTWLAFFIIIIVFCYFPRRFRRFIVNLEFFFPFSTA